jgi:ubiquinone/menaquinone biosynthesis C-methylase UbiE
MMAGKANDVGFDQSEHPTNAQLRDKAIGARYADRRMAANYAKLYGASDSVGRFLQSRLHVVSGALANVAGGNLLDVGCGPGMMVRKLLDSRPAAFRIVAVDRSLAMVEACITRIGNDDTVHALTARTEALPFQNDSFDVVLAMGVLEYTDSSIALAEIARVTRPGGRVVATMHNPLSPYRVTERYVHGPALGLLRTLKTTIKMRSARRRPRTSVQTYAVRERELRETMKRVGLLPLETLYFDVTFTVPPLDRYVRKWNRRWQTNPEVTVGQSWRKFFGTAYMIVAQAATNAAPVDGAS